MEVLVFMFVWEVEGVVVVKGRGSWEERRRWVSRVVCWEGILVDDRVEEIFISSFECGILGRGISI